MLNSKNITITSKIIKEAFTMFCIDQKYLSNQTFNKALDYIFKPPLPKIGNTYLGKKIFDIIDINKNGQLDEYTFCQCLTKILEDRNYRILLSMNAMMNIPDINKNYIEIIDIKNFIYNSYVEGFKLLGDLVELKEQELTRNNLPVANSNQLGFWAENYKSTIYNALDDDLNRFNYKTKNELDYNNFTNWIGMDHTIYLQYDCIKLNVATSLIVLDKIRFGDLDLKKNVLDNESNNDINQNIEERNKDNNERNNIRNNNNDSDNTKDSIKKRSYEDIPPIIDISFAIEENLKDCYSNLTKRGFSYVQGDIQNKGGSKYVSLGYKRGIEQDPITDIIGIVQENNTGKEIINQDGIEYKNIVDHKNNRDIHKGSGGNFLGFYYTRDKSKGDPIKELIFVCYPQKFSSNALEVIQKFNSKGNLNINEGRNKEVFNYIIIVR